MAPQGIPHTHQGAIEPGRVVGRYEVVRQLAVGGMAEVYIAKQAGPGSFTRDVVLKRIHPHLARDSEFVDMFVNEATLAATLSHPSIVHVYDLVESPQGEHFIAMEYVRGCTVLRLLRRLRKQKTRLPVPFALYITLRVCEALDYAYTTPGPDGQALRIVHRDVSPSNILVGVDGQVKLFDFGVARATSAAGTTRSGNIKGKLNYMSPEQVSGRSLDNRSDIFALGAVLYEMLVGARLFKRENEAAVIKAILADPVQPPSEVVAELPSELDDIVLCALAKDPDARYQHVGAMARDLEQVALDHQWTMRSSSLGRFIQAWFTEDELGLPGGSDLVPSSMSFSGSMRSSAPRSHGSSGLRPSNESAPPPRVSAPPSGGETAPSPSSDSSGGVEGTLRAQAAPPSIDRTMVIVVIGFVVASVLFWLFAFPRL
ncbi:MAG TPA: serine/threonine protein kinase [Polyangiaceae bacterium]|nr:serine/threonine protein kinase [Polyangiaceae bacterium]